MSAEENKALVRRFYGRISDKRGTGTKGAAARGHASKLPHQSKLASGRLHVRTSVQLKGPKASFLKARICEAELPNHSQLNP
jgi:hypothetical protein